jgi:dephospho-CoA kinase
MNRPLEVGITGGIGSGKSIVCRIFQCLGIPVYDADSRAKKLMTTDGILVEQIKKEFGTLSYYPDGSLNRAHLSQTVFGSPERLNTLNGMVHPRVGVDYEAWVQKYKESPYVIREAALLYEAGVHTSLGRIVVVYAPASIRIKRVLARDPQRTEQDVKNIMNNQWADEDKMKRADAIVYNDEQHLVIPQALSLHHQFLTAH